MKITDIRLWKLSVPLRVPFKTALRTVYRVEDVVVEVRTDEGAVGWGEAPPTGKITGDTFSGIVGAIRDHIAPSVIGREVEALEPLLTSFADHGIGGATILNSTGMARALHAYDDDSIFGSLRAILDPEREANKTIMTVLKDEQVDEALAAIEETVGDLSKPDTGIVFTVPVGFIKGMHK